VLCNFLQFFAVSSLLDPDAKSVLILCPFLQARYQVSHPYETTAKIIFCTFYFNFLRQIRGSSDSIVTRLWSGRPWFYSRQGWNFLLFATVFRPALGPTLPPVQWVAGVKRPGRGTGHSPLSNAEVKNAWSFTFTPPAHIHGMDLVKHRDNFTSFKQGQEHDWMEANILQFNELLILFWFLAVVFEYCHYFKRPKLAVNGRASSRGAVT
jgi:hypothetical protein